MAPKSLLYTIFSSLAVALAASVPHTDYEVMIIGGGPSGLSAASGLSRVRRKNIVFDSGEYRNGPTRNMHDVIGNDGSCPHFPAF
jgi:thioredoxin reductase